MSSLHQWPTFLASSSIWGSTIEERAREEKETQEKELRLQRAKCKQLTEELRALQDEISEIYTSMEINKKKICFNEEEAARHTKELSKLNRKCCSNEKKSETELQKLEEERISFLKTHKAKVEAAKKKAKDQRDEILAHKAQLDKRKTQLITKNSVLDKKLEDSEQLLKRKAQCIMSIEKELKGIDSLIRNRILADER